LFFQFTMAIFPLSIIIAKVKNPSKTTLDK